MAIGHTIRDRITITAQAVCSLEADRRWVVTGTPFQNRLTDLGSLLKFLRAHPFSDPTYFSKFTKKLTNTDFDSTYLSKLVNFMRCISIRRSKTVIDLPCREDKIYYLEFSGEERAAYYKVLTSTSRALKQAGAGTALDRSLYLHILSWINSLRMICNLGLCYQKKFLSEKTLSDWDQSVAQKTFEDICASGTAYCGICSIDLGSDLCEKPESDSSDLRSPYLSQCIQLVCNMCFNTELSMDQNITVCKHRPKCCFFPVSSTTALDGVSMWDNYSDPPTKIMALLNDLISAPSDEKRYRFLILLLPPA